MSIRTWLNTPIKKRERTRKTLIIITVLNAASAYLRTQRNIEVNKRLKALEDAQQKKADLRERRTGLGVTYP